ncbi:MAG: excinuclease ABC subunit UvrC [Gammaproteobacteria bacterium]|nr:excinuclease ABC subunit UvrC [Gammaproteobacteria bacterium]
MSGDFDPQALVRGLPRRPGVYRMLDRAGRVLYVGKARQLQRRVGSYFGRRPHDAKTEALLRLVAGVEVTLTGTEQEALLLEYTLIKEHKPRFNVVLRDDKSYPYIRVGTHQEFARFEFHRGSRQAPGRYFGPFPNAGAVRAMLQQLQKLFRIRPCSDTFFAHRSRPCLQYQIRRCSAPCTGLVTAEDYRRDVEDAMRFITGGGDDLLASLVGRMERCSAELEYEKAAGYRDQIAEIRRIQQQQAVAGSVAADADALAVAFEGDQCGVAVLMVRGGRVLGCRTFFPRVVAGTTAVEVLAAFLSQHYLDAATPPEILVAEPLEDAGLLGQLLGSRAGHAVAVRHNVRGTRRRWLELAATNARQEVAARAGASAAIAAQLQDLARALDLAAVPARIECFDVSHTQGGETVAACVALGPGGLLKSEYRRFNIRGVAAGDDYGALAEAVARRYRGGREAERPVPDLLLIDGGRGQLARIEPVLQELGLGDVALLGVAKGEGRRPGHERLFQPGQAAPLGVPADGGALRLIQLVRDEAHRFAITGHRQRRGRRQVQSVLDAITGLGPRRRRALLQRFGGLQGVRRAGIEDLARTEGISRTLAERIYAHLHDAPEGSAGG